MINLTEDLADLFKILSDPTRLEILEFLKDGNEKNATEIQEGLNKGQSSISQQLKILVGADLLEVRKESRNKLFKIKHHQILKLIINSKAFISNRSKENIEQQIEQITDSDIHDTLT